MSKNKLFPKPNPHRQHIIDLDWIVITDLTETGKSWGFTVGKRYQARAVEVDKDGEKIVVLECDRGLDMYLGDSQMNYYLERLGPHERKPFPDPNPHRALAVDGDYIIVTNLTERGKGRGFSVGGRYEIKTGFGTKPDSLMTKNDEGAFKYIVDEQMDYYLQRLGQDVVVIDDDNPLVARASDFFSRLRSGLSS
jgi:hypothetical protein